MPLVSQRRGRELVNPGDSITILPNQPWDMDYRSIYRVGLHGGLPTVFGACLRYCLVLIASRILTSHFRADGLY
jgi:hypothetical protein